MELSEDDIKKIQSYFASQKDIVTVYLYGSFAHGKQHNGSDLDIAVLFNNEANLYERLGRLYADFPKLSVKAEPEVRNINLKHSPVFLMNVVQGKNIYSRDEVKRIEFEVAVMREFYDTQMLRSIDYSYMKERIREGSYGY